jgi:uncharacterized protein YoxC
MIFEICAGVVSIAFVILVVFLIITLRRVIETLKQSKNTLKNVNHLTLDLQQKSEALNLFFRPLTNLTKKKTTPKNLKNYEKAAEVIKFASDGVLLFNKLKRKH